MLGLGDMLGSGETMNCSSFWRTMLNCQLIGIGHWSTCGLNTVIMIHSQVVFRGLPTSDYYKAVITLF